MKNLLKTLVLALFVATVLSCDAAQGKAATGKIASNASVEVYYFHFTRRCVTCNTVEAETKKDLEVLYSEQLKAGTMTFKGVNLDEAAGQALGEKLGVPGQSLLIVGGGKKVDLTEQGFMNARSNPEKLKAALKAAIDPLVH